MSLNREAIQARVVSKFYRDVQAVLEPLTRREHFAIDVAVTLNPPFPDEEARLDALSNPPRDEDLIPWVQQVRARVTVDQTIRSPAAKVISDTVSAAVDPLRLRTGDVIEVVYADLSSLKGKAQKTVGKPGVAKKNAAPAKPSIATTVVAPPQPTIVQVPTRDIDLFWPSVALIAGCALVALGIAWPLSRAAKAMLWGLGSLSDGVREAVENLGALLARQPMNTGGPTWSPPPASSVPDIDRNRPIQVAIVSAPAGSAAVAVAAGTPSPARAKLPDDEAVPGRVRVRPVSTYTLERQLNAKRKVLFQNPGAVARVLLKKFPPGCPEEALLSGFLKLLAPKETEALSRFLTADELIRFSQLAAAEFEKASVNTMIRFVDDLSPEVTTWAGLNVPVARAVELLEKFEADALADVVRTCSPEVASAILRAIPPERREEVFAKFEGQARESLLRQIAQPRTGDLSTLLPTIVDSAVRVCLKSGLKDLLLLWVSESRNLLSRDRYQELLASIREEASGLIADPRKK